MKKCGRSLNKLKVTGLPSDIEDTSAQPGEFPHMCAVYRYICTSSAHFTPAHFTELSEGPGLFWLVPR